MNKFELSYADLRRSHSNFANWQNGLTAVLLAVVLTCELLGWL